MYHRKLFCDVSVSHITNMQIFVSGSEVQLYLKKNVTDVVQKNIENDIVIL